MPKFTSTAVALAALAALAAPALAQAATTVQVAKSEKYGDYLATGEGRPVYLFTTDTQGKGGQEPQITCTSEECLLAWPLVTTEGEPQAGEAVKADMLGTTKYEGQTVVTYNGWPLYYFIRDAGADAPGKEMPEGHEIKSFGGEWYLVSPEGQKLHAE